MLVRAAIDLAHSLAAYRVSVRHALTLLAMAGFGGFTESHATVGQPKEAIVSWKHIRISRFGGPEVLEQVEESELPDPGSGEVRIKVLAAGTGFTDSFIRRGRYPDFKGPLPFTPGYEIVGVVDKIGPDVISPREGEIVADLCVVGGYAQYAVRPARWLVTVPDGVDPAEAACIPLAYLTAYQMLTHLRRLPAGATILVIGASGTVGTALLDLARHLGLRTMGTCSATNLPVVERFGGTAIDYRAGDFVAAVRRLTAGRPGGPGVDVAFDAIGGAHFGRSFACLAPGGLLVGYGSQTMAVGGEGLLSAGLGLARLKLWGALSFLFNGRRAVWYSVTSRRSARPEEFKDDITALLGLLRDGAIHPVVVDRLPLAAARAVHARIDAGGFGGKIVLLPWAAG
jgi:NADPH:quinone reductase-like Zn-dependent oxidoreductase